jgi:hypothetical protein
MQQLETTTTATVCVCVCVCMCVCVCVCILTVRMCNNWRLRSPLRCVCVCARRTQGGLNNLHTHATQCYTGRFQDGHEGHPCLPDLQPTVLTTAGIPVPIERECGGKQQTAKENSKKKDRDSTQQTADSRQQTANKRQQTGTRVRTSKRT